MSHASQPTEDRRRATTDAIAPRASEGRFASLFVELTGQTTIEARQQEDLDDRVTDADSEVGQYVARTARETGLGDTIDDVGDY